MKKKVKSNYGLLYDMAWPELSSFLINNLPVNINLIDTNGYIAWGNQRMLKTLNLFSLNDFKGKHISTWDNPNEIRWEFCKKVIESRKEIIIEESFNNIYYLAVRKPIICNGKVKGVLGISLDITKQKQAHIAKQEFLKNMAHDIRTPLSGVIGLAQLQKMGLESLEESKEYGEMIYSTSNQLLELLNAVIEVIDTEQMTDKVKMEPLDLSGLAKELHALMEPSLYTKGLKFVLAVDKALPIIQSDRIKLKRILLNILSNAVKFTKVGEIKFIIKLLGIENNKAKIEICITDTGIGIAKENLSKIFDRFYRAHPSYLAEYSGYGIGLYLAKETLELLGGNINVVSEEGKGSCFKLYFNFLVANKYLDKEKVVLSSYNVPAKLDSVLIAEDDAILLHVLKNQLEKAGYQIFATMDGKAALEALKTNQFAWALLDIGLPILRGTEACKHYREWEKENKRLYLPIFALTGHSVNEVEKECNEAGIDKIFMKPFNDKILQEIEQFVNK